MSKRIASSPLRRLALDYAEGRLGRADYVEKRRLFLDLLSAANGQSVVHSPPPSGPGKVPTRTRKPRGDPGPVRVLPLMATARPPWIKFLGAGLTLPLVALLWYGFRGDFGVPGPADTSAPATAPVAVTPAPPSPALPTVPPVHTAAGGAIEDGGAPAPRPPAFTLIEDLLRDGRWGSAERARFLDAWHQHSAADQTQARASIAFRRLEDKLTNLIDAERAAGVGRPPELVLVAFAREIGIDLPPPPGHASAAPQPAAKASPADPLAQRLPASARPGESAVVPPPLNEPVRPGHPQSGDEETRGATNPDAGSGGNADAPRLEAKSNPPAQTTLSIVEPSAEAQPDGVKTRPAAAAPDSGPIAAPTPAKPAPPEPVVPRVTERLSPHVGGDACASAAARARAAVYDCLDAFSSTGTNGLKLKAIPAEVPFAITIEQYDLDKWCARDPSPCAASADAQANALAYSIWLKGKTGKTYRPATAADVRQAAAYGISLPPEREHAVRLVRELGLPDSKAEAALLDRWWRQNHRPSP